MAKISVMQFISSLLWKYETKLKENFGLKKNENKKKGQLINVEDEKYQMTQYTS